MPDSVTNGNRSRIGLGILADHAARLDLAVLVEQHAREPRAAPMSQPDRITESRDLGARVDEAVVAEHDLARPSPTR